MTRRRLGGLAVAAGLALVVGCDGSSAPGPPNRDEVDFTIEGLPAGSPVAGHYELWISFFDPTAARHEAAAVSCGKFRADAAGGVVGLDGRPIRFAVTGLPAVQRDEAGNPIWQWALDAFLTWEPPGDADDQPNYPGFVGDSFLNGRAELGPGHGDALGDSLLGVDGAVLLATPSTSSTADELQGAWFSSDAAVPTAALVLPALPDTGSGAGWIYEGWIEVPGLAPATLGRFLDPDAADSDGPLFPGGQPGWPLPGSDYPFGVVPGPDLAPSTVFVTIEPASPDDDPGPFRALTILRGSVPAGWPSGTPVGLTPTLGEFPQGAVEIPFSR